MAKKNRYRWQNEKRALREQAIRQSLGRHETEDWGSSLRFYKLVSLIPLSYKRVR